jgi:mRNA-degrading endonuclease RelE of RelBE toxin-antitoxin system
VTGDQPRYRLVITPTARRQLAQHLPEAVAFAAHEFIVGARLENPQRVGKRLQAPLDDRHSARRGTYRIIHRIDRTTGLSQSSTSHKDETPTGRTADAEEQSHPSSGWACGDVTRGLRAGGPSTACVLASRV